MGTWDNSAASGKPLGGSRVIEGRRLAVQLHVPREDTWSVHPWVVQVTLASLDEHHLEFVIHIGQTACHDTPEVVSASEIHLLVASHTRMIHLRQQ